MTISKKLAFITSLALSIGSIAQGYYRVYEFNDEQQCMLNFSKELHQQSNVNAQSVASWLENKVHMAFLSDHDDIVAVVNIINDSALSISSKITLISSIIKQNKSRKQ